jgi:hypothetical protein
MNPNSHWLPASLDLTPNPRVRLDDEIFKRTLKEFPELAEDSYEKLRNLDESWMKSPDGKKRWRKFIESWCYFHIPLLTSHLTLPFQIQGQGFGLQLRFPHTHESRRRVF